MAFTPIYMVDKNGRKCLVGSATEREDLRLRGYRVVETPKPEPAKAPEQAPVPPVSADKKTPNTK